MRFVTNVLGNIYSDFLHTARKLRKAPVTTAVLVLTLSLGIGSTVSVFTLIYGVLVRSLPYPDSERIVLLDRAVRVGSIEANTTVHKYLFWRANQHTIAKLAADQGNRTVTLETKTPAERVTIQPVTSDFFQILNISPVAGRFFRSDDVSSLAVLNYEYWTDHLGRDPNLIGQAVPLGERLYTIIGIAPDKIDSSLKTDIWTLFDPSTDALGNGDNLKVLGLLKPGVSLEQARSDLSVVAEQFRSQFPKEMQASETVGVEAYQEEVGKKARPALFILSGAVFLVLIIVCSNIANVLGAQLSSRKHEFAVRISLGASRHRIVQQLVTESFCLSLIGCAGGIGMAYVVIDKISFLGQLNLPRLNEVRIDAPVLIFAVLLTGLTTIFFGLVPASNVLRRDIGTILKEESLRSGSTKGQVRMREALIVTEFTLCTVLLASALLLINSLIRLESVNPGFDPTDITVLQTGLNERRYDNTSKVFYFSQRIIEQISEDPGVEGVAMCSYLPLVNTFRLPLEATETHPKPAGHYLDTIKWMAVTPEFAHVMRIPLLRGREFSSSDSATSLPVVLVNATFAKRHFPAGDAVGRHIVLGWSILGAEYGDHPREIVGILGDIHESSLQKASLPSVFVPLSQVGDRAMMIVERIPVTLLVRTNPRARADLSRTITRQLQSVDPLQPINKITTMNQVVEDSMQEQRFQTGMLSLFTFSALALAMIGVYGVVSHSVAERKIEIGVRMAIGATPSQIMLMILKNTLKLTLLGIILAIPAILLIGRTLNAFLFGTSLYDPIATLLTPIILGFIAFLASYSPARLAAKTDVIDALRY